MGRMYWTMNLVTTIALASISSTVAFPGLSRISRDRVTALGDRRCEVDVLTRRETLQSWVVGAAAISTGLLASPEMASPFLNKISNQYDDRPKQRGSKVCVIWTVEVALVDYRFAINYSLKFDRYTFAAERTRCGHAKRYGRRRILGSKSVWLWWVLPLIRCLMLRFISYPISIAYCLRNNKSSPQLLLLHW